jgi:opacity protein-like surface antigen
MHAFIATLVVLVVAAMAVPAGAFEPNETYAKGTWIGSLEAGGGKQNNLEGHRRQTGVELVYGGLRFGYLPWDPLGRGWLRGSLELGLEPIYQHYIVPKGAYYAGLAAAGRYHVLSLGRFVPYVELLAAAGGTNFRGIEIDSDFAFWLAGGLGLSYFVTDTASVYAGYRMVHVSNGHIKDPNRGFEADTGVIGVSFFFK